MSTTKVSDQKPPSLLYKYVSAERALTCLPEAGNGALRATQPSALNDPFEGAVVPSFAEEGTPDDNEQLAKILTTLHGATPVTATDVAVARTTYGSMATRELFLRQTSQRFGLVSFATEPDHPLLWSHYTIDGSGFAIGYNVEELGHTARNVGGILDRVEYERKPPIILGYKVLNLENVRVLLTRKSRSWDHELEWRLIAELEKTVGTGKCDAHGQPINLVPIPNRAVQKIYYTERTPTDAVEKVKRRVANPNNRYQVGQFIKLVLSPNRYHYEEEA